MDIVKAHAEEASMVMENWLLLLLLILRGFSSWRTRYTKWTLGGL